MRVIYNDPRRFGFFEIIKNRQDLYKRFKLMGPEPFSDKFNLNYVFNFFKNKNKDIKSFLLDQRFVSGIGNIYASEILFASKINPFKKAKRLNKNECLKIILYSKKYFNRQLIREAQVLEILKISQVTKVPSKRSLKFINRKVLIVSVHSVRVL